MSSPAERHRDFPSSFRRCCPWPTVTLSNRLSRPTARPNRDEAHHLLHVMRAKAGTRVTLFDGSGWEFEAVVERAGRSEVELAIAGRQEIDREAQIAVTLGVALPKGERQKWLVEKVVELGVARLVPLETARGVAQPARMPWNACGVGSSRPPSNAGGTG